MNRMDLRHPPPARVSPIDFSKVEIRTTRISDNFFVLEGEGGRISVLTGPDGVLIPGHGPIVDRNAVIAQRDFVLATRDRMLPLISKGMHSTRCWLRI
jgi:hypothetical protein